MIFFIFGLAAESLMIYQWDKYNIIIFISLESLFLIRELHSLITNDWKKFFFPNRQEHRMCCKPQTSRTTNPRTGLGSEVISTPIYSKPTYLLWETSFWAKRQYLSCFWYCFHTSTFIYAYVCICIHVCDGYTINMMVWFVMFSSVWLLFPHYNLEQSN